MNITHDVRDAAYNICQTTILLDDTRISRLKTYLRRKWKLGTGWNGRGMIEVQPSGKQVYVALGDRDPVLVTL